MAFSRTVSSREAAVERTGMYLPRVRENAMQSCDCPAIRNTYLGMDTHCATELSRVRWQCRRGMLELDALLGGFVDTQYLSLSETQRRRFQDFLNYPDQILFDYFFGQAKPIDKDVADVIQWIRDAAASKT